MIIDKEWVETYIKRYGNKIIIPKEAKIIKSDSFTRSVDSEEKFEIYFENDSQLEEIEDRAFIMCNIVNRVVIPKSVKRIGEYIVYGYPVDIVIEEGSLLEECGTSVISLKDKSRKIPPGLKKLYIYEEADTQEIVIPKDSKIENIQMDNRYVRVIKLPNSQEITVAERECIKEFRKKNDKYLIIAYERDLKKYRYEFRDIETLEKVQEGKVCVGTSNPMEKPIFRYEDIFKVNAEDLEDTDRISLTSDDNGEYFWADYGTEEGKIYTKQEIMQIIEKLYKVINKINVPPEGVRDREKILYAQIVQNLYNELVYDSEVADLIDKYNQGEIEREDGDSSIKVDRTQNLKGMLDGKTVCRGFAEVVKVIANYFKLDCRVVSNETHAWNIVVLDGKKYEDDFTWYRDYLATSNLLGINTFLKGIDYSGNRSFDKINKHDIGVAFELDEDLPPRARIALLGTDWSKIEDWTSVNIWQDTKVDLMLEQMQSFVKDRGTQIWRASRRIYGRVGENVKSFLIKIRGLFRDKSRGE